MSTNATKQLMILERVTAMASRRAVVIFRRLTRYWVMRERY